MSHQIKYEDIKDFSFDRILASDSAIGKQLIVRVFPAKNEMYYVLSFKMETKASKEGKFVTKIFKEALDQYNLTE